ncbi:MAG: aminoglycoside phosphotransferase family protein [bacterium]
MNPAHAAQQFDVPGRLVAITAYGSGNVNDTYLAIFRTTFSEERVVVQRINTSVFSRPEWIMENMRVVTEHVHRKLEREQDLADRIWQMPRVIPSKDGKDFHVDSEGNYWRVITLMASAKAYDKTTNADHAFEVGTVLGQFHRLISDIDPSRLHDTLPGFHKTPLYLQKYDETVRTQSARALLDKSIEARRLVRFIEERRDLAKVLESALENGELAVRLIHGDPKVTNIMIDDVTGKGTSIVDLDTVKPGLVHYDFGDAVRSVCNPAGEETTNLNDVVFDLDLCEAIFKGYMINGLQFLTQSERKYLFASVRLLPFELGLRFFQDYLAGNVYFRVRSEEQNLNRARVQFKLCESIETRARAIRSVLEGPLTTQLS